MANFLLRHLTETRKTIPTIQYSKYFGFKTPAILDRVIPNVPENLRNSTEAFIDALINCDEEFIQATSTGALQRKLMPELQKLKNSKTKISLVDKDGSEEDGKGGNTVKDGEGRPDPMMIISPYVIFGQTMEARAALQDPWKYCHRVLSLNRYIYIDPSQSFSTKDVMNNHIYGFNCFTLYKTKQFKVTDGSSSTLHACPELLISFETNSQNHEFYVSDFNCLVQYP